MKAERSTPSGMPTWYWPVIGAIAAIAVIGSVGIWVSTRESGPTATVEPRREDARVEPLDDGSPRDARTASDQPATGTGSATRPRERVVGCDDAEELTIPGTDIAIAPMTRAQEAEIGASYVPEVAGYYPASADREMQRRLDEMLAELAPPIDGVAFSVTLVESSEVNAFALPGGPMFVTTAIVDELSDDELAFVIGHEVAHVECRHIARQLEREALAVAAVDAVLGDRVDADSLYRSQLGQDVAMLASLSFSRDDELQADLRSLDLLERAGRPTAAAADALRRLMGFAIEPTNELEEFLSTHPPTEDRIAAVAANS